MLVVIGGDDDDAQVKFCRLPQVLSHGENSASQGQCHCGDQKGFRKWQKGHNSRIQNKTTKYKIQSLKVVAVIFEKI